MKYLKKNMDIKSNMDYGKQNQTLIKQEDWKRHAN